MIFKARNAETGEGALVRVYGKDTDLLLDRRYGGYACVCVCVFFLVWFLPYGKYRVVWIFVLLFPLLCSI